MSAYKEAGYKTYYISYLSQAHVGDNAINQIVNEADTYIRRKSGYDDKGLEDIKNALQSPGDKKLIIYKLIGSHFNYQDRYPPEYNIFKPSFKDLEYYSPSVKDINILVNSYDNSILFTDFVTNEVIKILKEQDGINILAFISDHGTAIYEDGKSLYGGNTKANYNIPLFFWFNKEGENTFHKEIEILKTNVNKPIDADYFIDTMFDISGLKTEKRKGYTLVDKNLIPKKRVVTTAGELFNYDELPD
nr:sulfatase-like hydrolase/transferase [Photorhabdus temperata]